MEERHQGDPRSPRVPRPADVLARFPGPVAIAAEPVGGASAILGVEEIDGQPWAVEVGYTAAGRHLLTVRTVRSTAGLDPRGLTVESLASAVVAFAARDEGARPLGVPVTLAEGDAERRIAAHIAASRLTREQVARTPTRHTTLEIGGTAIPGDRVDLAECSAVDLAWDGQTVYCAGRPEIIDTLKLRPATPSDFDEEIPQP